MDFNPTIVSIAPDASAIAWNSKNRALHCPIDQPIEIELHDSPERNGAGSESEVGIRALRYKSNHMDLFS